MFYPRPAKLQYCVDLYSPKDAELEAGIVWIWLHLKSVEELEGGPCGPWLTLEI